MTRYFISWTSGVRLPSAIYTALVIYDGGFVPYECAEYRFHVFSGFIASDK